MIKPSLLCNQHLLGEHGELHKFIPSFKKQYKVSKRINPVVQIELTSYKKRHDDLAKEMLSRGMNHKSPINELPDFSYLPKPHYNAIVDIKQSIKDLKERCVHCKKLIEESNNG